MRDRVLLAVALLAIALATVPWTAFVGHAHWDRVMWVPRIVGIRLGDLIGNVLLYLPAGWAAARLSRTRRADVAIIAGAAGLSAAIEALQVLTHGRFPTTVDLLMNTLGAAIGVWLASRRRQETR